MATTTVRPPKESSNEVTVIESERRIQNLLDVLHDADSRKILDATTDDVLSANEISEACELPLSTTYRKLDLLTEAGLLEERTRVRRSGKHTSEYSRFVEDVVISVTPNGDTELQVSWRGNSEYRALSASAMGE